jgi:DNA-directed RNA polymerase sigma subunit (sigma70/sigma32)
LTPLIRNYANKYKNSGLPYESLELEGKRLAGQAIDTYDPQRGTQLNTHVATYLQKLNRFTNDYQNVGHIPEPRAAIIGKYNVIFDNLKAEKGREPSIEELSDVMQVSQAEIVRLQSELRADLHMELPSSDEDGKGFSYYVMPNESNPQLREALEFVYFDAEPVDKKIMEYTFGLAGAQQLTGQEIKNKLNLTETDFRRRKDKLSNEIRQLM